MLAGRRVFIREVPASQSLVTGKLDDDESFRIPVAFNEFMLGVRYNDLLASGSVDEPRTRLEVSPVALGICDVYLCHEIAFLHSLYCRCLLMKLLPLHVFVKERANIAENVQKLVASELTVFAALNGNQLVRNALVVERAVQPHRVVIWHDLVHVSVNG